MTRRAGPCLQVVNIFTSKNGSRRSPNPANRGSVVPVLLWRPAAGAPGAGVSLGSGVIVGAGVTVLANHRVVDGADEIEIALTDGRWANAKVVGSNPETDLRRAQGDAPRTCRRSCWAGSRT